MARYRHHLRVLTVNVNKIVSDRKIFALLQFLRDCKCDVIFLQEVTAEVIEHLNNYSVLVNIDPETTHGTAILTTPGLEITNVDILPNGRGIACVFQDLTLVNVYAPSGTDNKHQRSVFFGTDICQLLYRNRRHVILGGDFNCVLRDEDQEPRANKCYELQTLVDTFHLVDTWTSFAPDAKGFTYFYPSGRSRLDRLYVSRDLTTNITQAEIVPAIFSDHCGYYCDLHIPYVPPIRKYTSWKLNVSVLEDVTLEAQILETWQRILPFRAETATVLEWWLRFAKPAIRQLLINYSRDKAFWERESMNFYRDCLKDLVSRVTDNPALLPSLKKLKAKILQGLNAKAAGTIIRSGTVASVQEESLSLYHLKRERQLRDKIYINEWITTDGAKTTNDKIITTELHDHFSTLFNHKPFEMDALLSFLQDVPHVLTRPDRLLLNERFTEDDIREAVKASPKGKAPGADGIPVEFYLKFYDLLKETFVAIANEIHNGIKIPQEFVKGLIVIIPKTKATPCTTTVRPITLLNADYKIIARSISHRLKPALKKVISSAQSCAVPGRNIYEAVLAYRDSIAYATTRRGNRAAILSIDFKNAFDRINHEYLHKVMFKMGFGMKFPKMIYNILQAATSRILFNGRPGSSIDIRRSVRQGCTLSMSLFAIALDPLLRRLNNNCRGLALGARPLVCQAYADDLGVFMEHIGDIDTVYYTLVQFEKASGAVVNPGKSVLLPLTANMKTAKRDWYTIKEQHTILGVQMTANAQKMAALN